MVNLFAKASRWREKEWVCARQYPTITIDKKSIELKCSGQTGFVFARYEFFVCILMSDGRKHPLIKSCFILSKEVWLFRGASITLVDSSTKRDSYAERIIHVFICTVIDLRRCVRAHSTAHSVIFLHCFIGIGVRDTVRKAAVTSSIWIWSFSVRHYLGWFTCKGNVMRDDCSSNDPSKIGKLVFVRKFPCDA